MCLLIEWWASPEEHMGGRNGRGRCAHVMVPSPPSSLWAFYKKKTSQPSAVVERVRVKVGPNSTTCAHHFNLENFIVSKWKQVAVWKLECWMKLKITRVFSAWKNWLNSNYIIPVYKLDRHLLICNLQPSGLKRTNVVVFQAAPMLFSSSFFSLCIKCVFGLKQLTWFFNVIFRIWFIGVGVEPNIDPNTL